MTLPPLSKLRRSFSAAVVELDLPLPAHDAVLAGDTLSSVQINHRWRRYISLALEERFSRTIAGLNETDYDAFIQVWDALMIDIDD